MTVTTAAIAGHIVWVHREWLPNGGHFAYVPYHEDKVSVEIRCGILNRIDNPPLCNECDEWEFHPFTNKCLVHDSLNRELKGNDG